MFGRRFPDSIGANRPDWHFSGPSGKDYHNPAKIGPFGVATGQF
jgi:hypothetical protein